jgi:serine protease Do
VAQVTPDSPAQKAGVKEGDIIVGYQNKPVTDIGDFRNQVALTQPDSQANLEVLRDGQPRNLKVTIGSLDDSAALVAQGGGAAARELGIAVQTPTPEVAAQLGIEPGRGVVVTEVDPQSSAARNGFQPGTVILQVNQVPVNDAEAFYEAVENSPDNRAVLLVRSGNAQQYVVLNW